MQRRRGGRLIGEYAGENDRVRSDAFTMALVIGTCCLVTLSRAHHSTAEYDHDVLVELEGELISVYWGNPHPRYRLRSVTADGQERIHDLEGSAVYVLERVGVREDMIREGASVRVAGYRSSRRADWIQVSNMLLESGYEVLERGAERRWTDAVGGTTVAGDRDTAAGDRGLFRVWSRAALADGLDFGALPLTATAAARQAAWHPVDDNPALSCVAHGMPAIMPNPFPIAFVNHDDWIELNLSQTVVRTIHLTDRGEAQEATAQGYSTGRWDGKTLEIETRRVEWPYFDDNGTPQSESVEIVERFVLSDDGTRLDYAITVTDPEVFTAPVTASVSYAALGEPLHNYQYCP